MMKKLIYTPLIFCLFVILWACSSKPEININLSDKFEDQQVEIISLLDSTILASGNVVDGKVSLIPSAGEPVFTSIVIDGKRRAFYITESGTAELTDSMSSAVGTPLNDKFSELLNTLDSIEQIDDMKLYTDFVAKSYNENKDNPIGQYFCIEWIKYADPSIVDSILSSAPQIIQNSKVAKKYQEFAKLRAKTSPGHPYVNFEGENQNGSSVSLSSFIKPGNYTLVDFWASWCPYCIRELPEMKNLYEEWHNKGFEIVGVAVRDVTADTKNAVEKYDISWPVIYNTQRKPYDIYGFSGIPYHLLIGPDGNIVSTGETISQINEFLTNTLGEKAK